MNVKTVEVKFLAEEEMNLKKLFWTHIIRRFVSKVYIYICICYFCKVIFKLVVSFDNKHCSCEHHHTSDFIQFIFIFTT